ncbi:uncharacterized protein [Medicago truncatula]|nr:uncharacterized protein LOC120580570 [Medicago truncatula]
MGKARRQGDRGRDRQRKVKRFRDWDEAGKRQSRTRDSRRFGYGSDADFYQDRLAERSDEELRKDWLRFENRNRASGHSSGVAGYARRIPALDRLGEGGRKQDTRDISGATKALTNAALFRRYVTFYFTNFPPFLSNFYLRKGFEVCGMLDEVVVPRRCNVNGERYGFVRYSNVRDVSKLLKAVNTVCFGNFQIKAKVANFDKAAARVVENLVVGAGAKDTAGGGVKVGKGVKSVVEGDVMEAGSKAVEGQSDGLEGRVPQARVGALDNVQVGDVTVSLGKGHSKEQQGGSGKSKFVKFDVRHTGGRPSIQNLVRMYRSSVEDLQWARSGVTATVTNGESIRGVQDRIADAGISEIDIIPLGADKVFIRSMSEVSVTTILNDAKDFFAYFFTNIVRWDKNLVPFQRGAWLRLYGIPLHAWNESFFKLCILDVGRLLRMDTCTVEKERFDYARILVATNSLEIINCSEKLLIDGVLVTVKVVEEWGFNIGDDACLYEEEENGSIEGQADPEDVHIDHEHEVNADFLVDKIVQDFFDSESNGRIFEDKVEKAVSKTVKLKAVGGQSKVGRCSEALLEGDLQPLRLEPFVDQLMGSASPECKVDGHGSADVPVDRSVDADECPSDGGSVTVRKLRTRRMVSCPPRADRSVVSGPWSLDWINDQHLSDVGVVSSSRKFDAKGKRLKACRNIQEDVVVKRKKVKGLLRHSVLSLKKVARLPTKDRKVVMKILKKNDRKFKGSNSIRKTARMISKDLSENSSSSSSINNSDWKHWVVLHGSDKVVAEDVKTLGESIGVNLSGYNNRFGVLARKGMGKKKKLAFGDGGSGGAVEGVV